MRSALRLSFAVSFLLFSPPPRPVPISIPFEITDNGLIQVMCQMQSNAGEVLSCIIDTGAQNSMATASSVSSQSMRGTPTIGFQTAAGRQTAHLTKQVILLGEVHLPATVEVTPLIRAMNADVLIGEDVLSRFQSVSIDYKHHVLTCEAKPGT